MKKKENILPDEALTTEKKKVNAIPIGDGENRARKSLPLSNVDARWICSLCGGAVGEELGRASPPSSPVVALDRHACVHQETSAPPSSVSSSNDLIAALCRLLRRRLQLPSVPTPRKV